LLHPCQCCTHCLLSPSLTYAAGCATVLPAPLQLQLAAAVAIVSYRLILMVLLEPVIAMWPMLLLLVLCIHYLLCSLHDHLAKQCHLLSPHSSLVDWCFFLIVFPCGCHALIDAAAVIVITTLPFAACCCSFPMPMLFLLAVSSKLPLLLLDCCFLLRLLLRSLWMLIHHRSLSVYSPAPPPHCCCCHQLISKVFEVFSCSLLLNLLPHGTLCSIKVDKNHTGMNECCVSSWFCSHPVGPYPWDQEWTTNPYQDRPPPHLTIAQ